MVANRWECLIADFKVELDLSKDAKAKDIPGFEVAGEHIGQELQSLEAAKASLRASDAL